MDSVDEECGLVEGDVAFFMPVQGGGGERDRARGGGDRSVVACTHPYSGVTQHEGDSDAVGADDGVGWVTIELVRPVVQERAGVPHLGFAFGPVGERQHLRIHPVQGEGVGVTYLLALTCLGVHNHQPLILGLAGGVRGDSDTSQDDGEDEDTNTSDEGLPLTGHATSLRAVPGALTRATCSATKRASLFH